MAKHSLLFCSTTIPLPLIGNYRLVKSQKFNEDALTFKHLDHGSFIQIRSDGKILFQTASDLDFYWTYITNVEEVSYTSAWHTTFDYFHTTLMIQRVGGSMKIGELASVENINTDEVSIFDTEVR